jgi:zinc protease
MTVPFVEPSHDLPLLSVAIAFRSGATHDPPGKEGLARITARMLRRGSRGLSADAIEERIDLLGGELGADASHSASSLSFEVLKRSAAPFVELAASVLAEPAFDQEELARLLREAEAELIEARDNDRGLAGRAFRRTLFRGHPYGRRVAGSIESLRGITRDDVVAFYKRHYTRENALVAVSGDVTHTEAARLVERVLDGLPAGEPIGDEVPPPERLPGRHLILVDKGERTQTQMIVGSLGTHAQDSDHVPLMVANTAFGGTFTARLMQEIRAKRGWSYGAYSRVGFDRQREAFTISTAPAATDAAACLALELEMLGAFLRDGVTAEELDAVKSYLVRSHAFEIDTAKKRVHQKLEVALFDLPEGYHELYVERVRAVTVGAANAAVRERLTDKDLVVSVVASREELAGPLGEALAPLVSTTVLATDFE